MIDNTGLKLSDFSIEEYYSVLNKLKLSVPEYSTIMTTYWGNVRLKYYPNDRTLVLRNSLHKLYNGFVGEMKDYINWNDYLFENAETMKELFVDVFERPASDFKIHSTFEWGVNIDTEVDPCKIFYRYISYASKSINSELYAISYNKGKDIQRELGLSEWRIKFYDKGKQAHLTKRNVFRFELVIHQIRRLRKILGVNDVTLETITEKVNWIKLKDELIRVYDSIRKIPMFTSKVDIPVNDYLKLYAYCNSSIMKDIKSQYGEYTAKKLRAECRSVYEGLNQDTNNLHNKIRQRIIGKCEHLLTGNISSYTSCYYNELSMVIQNEVNI